MVNQGSIESGNSSRAPLRKFKPHSASKTITASTNSNTTTQESTPEGEKVCDFQLLLNSAIHTNFINKDDNFNSSALNGHCISKDYRTKMLDWMVEVTTSFKCSDRTYFLEVRLFDEYLRKSFKNGQKLEN